MAARLVFVPQIGAAAGFGPVTTDQTVLVTVAGLESLTTGVSRKIWQKIALLPAVRDTTGVSPSADGSL